MQISAETTLREIAIKRPRATRILYEHRLDYCCGGERSLRQACEEAGIPVEVLLEALRQETHTVAYEESWENRSLSALIQHIVSQHHELTRSELERLQPLLEKVVARHSGAHAELKRLSLLVEALRNDMEPHLLKEERVLFPYIVALEKSVQETSPPPRAMFGTVANPVRVMMTEHETAGEILAELRDLTRDYTPPPDGCASYQLLYQVLGELEKDLIQHMHLENNILFPRALALEAEAHNTSFYSPSR